MNPRIADPHEELAALAAAYAIDVLDAPEREQFERHLATCAACQADVASYREVGAAVGATAPTITPPPDLRQRVIAAATGEAAPIGRKRKTFRPPAAWWLAAAASVAVACGKISAMR